MRHRRETTDLNGDGLEAPRRIARRLKYLVESGQLPSPVTVRVTHWDGDVPRFAPCAPSRWVLAERAARRARGGRSLAAMQARLARVMAPARHGPGHWAGRLGYMRAKQALAALDL